MKKNTFFFVRTAIEYKETDVIVIQIQIKKNAKGQNVKKPIIVVNMFFAQYDEPRQAHIVRDEYVQRVHDTGGMPVLMPVIDDPELMQFYLNLADGVLLIGGKDYPAELYHETSLLATDRSRLRPEFDLHFARELLKTSLPVLGICGGCQLLAIAANGKLIQDLPNAKDVHTSGKFHSARVIRDGFFRRIMKDETEFTVNSFHHQAVNPEFPGEGFVITGEAMDGSVEAIEMPGPRMVLGVQFHPERMNTLSNRFLGCLVRCAAAHKDGLPTDSIFQQ